MQGTLELKESKKKNALFTKYTSAYLTLNSTGIAIFRDATLKHALSSYPLRCVDHIGISDKKKRKFVIHIRESYNTQPTVKLGFRAPHVIVADAWVDSLQKALSEYKSAAKTNRADLLLAPGPGGMKRSESMLTPKTIRTPPPPPPATAPVAASLGKLHANKQQTLDHLLLDTMTDHGSLVGGDLLMRDPGLCLRLMLTAQHKFLQTKDMQNPEGRQRARSRQQSRVNDSRGSLERLDLGDLDAHAIQAERELNEQHAKDVRTLQLKRKRMILRLDELGIDWDMDFVDKLIRDERIFSNPKKYTAPPEALTPKRTPVHTFSQLEHGSLGSLPTIGRHFVFHQEEDDTSNSDSSDHGPKRSPSRRVGSGGGSSFFQDHRNKPSTPNGKGSVAYSPSSRALGASSSSSSSASACAVVISGSASPSSRNSAPSNSPSSLSKQNVSSPTIVLSSPGTSPRSPASSASRSPPPPPPIPTRVVIAPPPPSPRASYQDHHERSSYHDHSPPTTPIASMEGRPTHSRSRTLPRLDDATILKPSVLLRRITCTAEGCFEDVEGWQRFKASLQSAKAAGHFCPKHFKQIEEARQKCLVHLTIDAVTTKHGSTFLSVLKQMMHTRSDLHPALLRVLWISLNNLYPPELVTETTSLRTRRRVTLTKMRSSSTLKTQTTDERKVEENKQGQEPSILVSSGLAVDQFSDATIKYCVGDQLTEQIKHALFAILLNSNYGVTERVSEPTHIVLRTPVVNPPIWFVILGTTGGCKFELRVKILYDVMSLLIQNDFNCLSVVSQEGWQSSLLALLFDSPLVDWVEKEAQDLIKQMHNFWLNVFMMLHVYTFKHAAERSELNFGPTIRTTFATMGKMCEPNVKQDIFVRYFFVALLSKIHGEGVFCHGSLGAHCFANLHALSELCAQYISTSRFLDQFSAKGACIHRLVKTALKLPENKETRSPILKPSDAKDGVSISPPTSAPTSPELRPRRGLSLDAGSSTPAAIVVNKKHNKGSFGGGRLSFGSSTDLRDGKSTIDLAKLLEAAGDDELMRSPLFTRPSCLFKPLEVDQKAVSVAKAGPPPKIEVACECGAMVNVNIQCCPKCGTRIPRRVKKLAMDRGDALEREKKAVALVKQKYVALQKKARECHVDADTLLGAIDASNPTAFMLDIRSTESEDKPSDPLYSLHLRSSSTLWTTHYGPPTEECEDMVLVDKLLDVYKDAHVADYDGALHPNYTEQERAMYESAHADYLFWVTVREMFVVLNEVEARSLDPLVIIEFLQKFWIVSQKERVALLSKFSKAVKESKAVV